MSIHSREDTGAYVGQVFFAGKYFWRVLPYKPPKGFLRLPTEIIEPTPPFGVR
jgi:hypothetical protein